MTKQSDDRRIAVLSALRECESCSGEALATSLGVSRVAVRKHVTALREMGYEIEARAGEGYRLTSTPDAPLPYEVAPLMRTAFYPRIDGKVRTGSTNDDARALALADAPEGTVVLAREQESGRGRLGRRWTSPAGGLYASIVLRPEVETPQAIVLPLVVGVGTALGLESLGADVRLKWPNDLLAPDGRKIGGILCEGLSEGWRITWIVAGIGINVRHAPDEAPCVCLDDLVGRRVPLATAAAALLDGIAEAYARWSRDGFDPLRADYERRSWLDGREVTVSDVHGGVLASGIASGIDATGRLIVETAEGPKAMLAGDVTLREPTTREA
ncbi:MAG: biotin--[acetyl-CoA-carboxylase] ligase [Coriobacteriia bacterium]|nr:biotin--[acetyl-CoA-carboxylase] ligase [Coriobacteriia bacterium]